MPRVHRFRAHRTRISDVHLRIRPFLDALRAREQTGNLVVRDASEHLAAAGRGWHVYVEDVHTGAVAASAAAFEMPSSGSIELANAAVDPDHRRLGLHPLLIHLRVARLALSAPGWTRLVCATVPESTTDRNLARLAWSEWTTPSRDFLDVCVRDACARREEAVAAGRACCCRYWQLGAPTHRRLVADLLAAEDHVLLPDGSTVEIGPSFLDEAERAQLGSFARVAEVA